MNDTTPITQAEFAELLAMYFDPIYKLLGGVMALSLFVILYWILIRPFLKKGRGL